LAAFENATRRQLRSSREYVQIQKTPFASLPASDDRVIGRFYVFPRDSPISIAVSSAA
jgi:hypothetical protein